MISNLPVFPGIEPLQKNRMTVHRATAPTITQKIPERCDPSENPRLTRAAQTLIMMKEEAMSNGNSELVRRCSVNPVPPQPRVLLLAVR